MGGVLERYRPREVAWASADAKTVLESKKPVVVVYADSTKESAEALKLLRDRQVAFFHDRFVFVRSAWKKDSEDAKKWAVAQAPAFLVMDPARSEVLERVALPKAAWELKGALTRALAQLSEKK
jgi:acyl-CoA synthetase (NDP forming)